MRIERAIDAFLDWRRIERDATPRSVDSYQRILFKLAEDYPEVDLAKLTTADLRTCLKRWEKTSTSTRSNVISVIHSFFRWANEEDMIPHDPSAKIRRPPKRKPDRYRPTSDELARIRADLLTPAWSFWKQQDCARRSFAGAGGPTSTWCAAKCAFFEGPKLVIPPARAGRRGGAPCIVPGPATGARRPRIRSRGRTMDLAVRASTTTERPKAAC